MMTGIDVSKNEEAVRRRRAVYTGLRPYMEEDQVLEALLLWEERFADGPVYALHGFVSEVCRLGGLASRHGEIYRSLMRALTQDEGELQADPAPSLERYARDRATPAATPVQAPARDCAHITVFAAVSDALLATLEERDSERAFKVRVDVMDRLNELRLPPRQAQAVSRWLMQQGNDLPCELDETVLQGLLHRLYVRGCELFGPVQVDQALAEATRKAQALPAAQQFAPRRLL